MLFRSSNQPQNINTIWRYVKIKKKKIRKIHCNLQHAEEKLRSNMEISWLHNIQYLPKLRTYSILKSRYNTEDYVKLDIPKPLRSTMAMFRCGVLPLRIETGRYKGEPVEDRICTMCNLNEIESEKHFLLFCPLYKEQRKILYNEIGVHVNLNQIDSVFTTIICAFPRQTAKFIYNSYNVRQEHMRKPT